MVNGRDHEYYFSCQEIWFVVGHADRQVIYLLFDLLSLYSQPDEIHTSSTRDVVTILLSLL